MRKSSKKSSKDLFWDPEAIETTADSAVRAIEQMRDAVVDLRIEVVKLRGALLESRAREEENK